MKFTCFWMKQTSKVRRSIIVIGLMSVCAKRGLNCCRSDVFLEFLEARVDRYGYTEWVDVPDPDPLDPIWPTKCQHCGKPFGDDIMRSTMQEPVYRALDREMTITEAPYGAMWNEIGFFTENVVGPDGLCIVVKTPGGNWCVDGPARGGAKDGAHVWSRTGTPPVISVTPSIHILNHEGQTVYHGWLTNGVLIDA